MSCFAELDLEYRTGREQVPPEDFSAWCRIEDLSDACGLDPFTQSGLLRELAETYPGRAGRDPEGMREEHPVQALACAVRRYLAEYPEEAAARIAAAAGIRAGETAAEGAVPEEQRPEKAA